MDPADAKGPIDGGFWITDQVRLAESERRRTAWSEKARRLTTVVRYRGAACVTSRNAGYSGSKVSLNRNKSDDDTTVRKQIAAV